MRLLRHPLFFAPHRFFFALGFAQLLVLLLFWALEMLARVGGNGLPWSDLAPARWLHAVMFVGGPFPLWIFAFAFTAMPRWLKLPPLLPAAWLPAGLTLAAGWLLADLGLFFGLRGVLLVGLGTVGAGWGMALPPLWRIARRAAGGDWHPRLLALSVSLGVPALWLSIWGLASAHAGRVDAGIALGIWFFLLPAFVVVVHRMLPFFTRSAFPEAQPWQPLPVLWGLLAALWLHGLLLIAGQPALLWLPDTAGAALALLLSWRWDLRASFGNRLLATHHLAFAWFGAGLALSALQSLAQAGGLVVGGLAALHALLFGFALSMVFGMATRVTLGHSAQPVRASDRVWRLFFVLQAAVVLRLVAELLPALAVVLLPLVAVATLGIFVAWVGWHARYWAIDADE